MPIVGLQIKAELLNVKELSLPYKSRLNVGIKCSSCGEVHPNIWIDRDEEFELDKRGTAHVVVKCKLCGRTNNITIMEHPGEEYSSYSDSGNWHTLAYFDQRGCELVSFNPQDISWSARGENSGFEFEDIDLSEDWFDFDEKEDCEVSVTEFESQFVKFDKMPKLKADGDEDEEEDGKKGRKKGRRR